MDQPVAGNGRLEVAVPCWDAAGRLRTLTVAVTADQRVSIGIPPGGSATLQGHQIAQAIDALRATSEVIRQPTRSARLLPPT